MFCKNCGHELPEDAKFCMKCGTLLKSESSSTETDGKPIASNAEGSQTVHTSAVANRERLLWVMVVILVVVVGILAVALGTTKMGNQNNVEPNNENIAEVQDSQETTTTDLTTTATTTKVTTKMITTVTTTTTVATTAKPVVTTTAEPKPYVTASAKTFLLSGYDGSKVRLYLDGNFYKAYIKINGISYDTTVLRSDFSDYVELPFNPIANSETTLSVTPYDDAGNAGDTVTCAIPTDAEGTINTGGILIDGLNIRGQINCHGGVVAGYTTDYVVNGGACGMVRQSLGDTWHITAKNSCYNYGTNWYELWDSDDGDYYGWVDENYIDFY